jgi:50S ribosomal protein L16 3-hydroxylase
VPPAGQRLGEFSPRQFLARYWQRKPLLIRQALPGLFEGAGTTARDSSPAGKPAEAAGAAGAARRTPPPLFSVREILALARDPDVESRLVVAPPAPAGTAAAGEQPGWKLRHGPFGRLPPRSRPGWTLLVQGVDLRLPHARSLMDRFRFIPDARLDDLMVSYASDGGGVGPHVDSYDVFLLQVHGRRRWRISPPGPTRLVPNAPLKLLADFRSSDDWLLEPGDMLYLPPGWGHEGTAVGECMTCSIGFRAPSDDELRRAFHAFLADHPPPAITPGRRYRDRALTPAAHPAEIPADMARTLAGWLRQRPSPALVERFLGCYLTEPKPSVWFDPPQEAVAIPPDAALVLDRRSRMLYRGNACYLNGEAVEWDGADRESRALVRALADRRGLDAVQTKRALRLPWLRDRLQDWLSSGWIRLAGT